MKKQILLLLIASTLALAVCGTVAAVNNTTEIVSVSTNGSVSNGYNSEPSISADGRYVAFSSYADNLVENDTNSYMDIFIRDRLLNTTERVSVSSTNEQANGDSYHPSISADGRFVAFTSYSTNLAGGSNNGVSNIFVRDRLLNATRLVSASNTGETGNGNSFDPSISANGHYIAFSSYASNLVDSDTNDCSDIFVYDRTSNTIKRISVSNAGEEGNGDSYEPSISGNGNFIAFTSCADNLVENDINNFSDVFVYDQTSGKIKRVSISSSGEEGNSDSYEPSISTDGRYIAFTSYADNLIDTDTNENRDVFVHDQLSGITERVSISSDGEQFYEDSYNPSISGDGRYIAFVSGTVRPCVSSFNALIFKNGNNHVSIFVHDMISKITRKVSVSNTGEEPNSDSSEPSLSAEGSFVAFNSYASNLVPEDNNYCTDIFVHSIDNIPHISAVIYPEIVKSGNQITVRAYAPHSINITALILGHTLTMEKRADGLWYLTYTVPNVPDGIYNVLLTSTDSVDNQTQINLNFTVDNTPPTISGTITPNIGKSGDYISIDALTRSDTISVTVLINGEIFNMYKQPDGSWNLYYSIPDISDGIYPVLLTATDKAGNQNTFSLNFTVDNRPPTISGFLNPETVKTFDKINLTATSDPDTVSITALIFNQTYDLIKQPDSTWSLQYTIPEVTDGNYSILLIATDSAGNQGTLLLNFNVFNPTDNIPPTVTGTITHSYLLKGIMYKPSITIKAFSDPDTIRVTASIIGKNYTLTRQEDGSWSCYYLSYLGEGTYTAVLTAKDWSGNHGNATIIFNVENIIPTIITTSSPEKLRSGDLLTLNVFTNPDAYNVFASTPTGYINLMKQGNGSWSLQYTVPQLKDGKYTIWITVSYGIGWWSHDASTIIWMDSSTSFTVDNTPPYISGSTTPNPLRSGDTLKIKTSCSTGSYNLPNDTINVTAKILGKTFNMTKLYDWSDWWSWNSGSDWNIDYVVPNLPDGAYTIYITATDSVGNQGTVPINFTVDNTPPVITATINPNTLKFIDFSTDRSIRITAQSSSDTKAVYAFIDNSWRALTYSNGYWTYTFGVPHIITIGTHTIQLKAIDYAGNEGICYVSYKAVDFSGSSTPPSGWSGIGIGGGFNGGSSGTGGSSGNGGSGSQGGSSEGSTGSSGSGSSSGGSSGGSSSGSSGDSPDSNEPPTSPDYTIFLIILLVVVLLLALIFLWYIGALSTLWFFLEILFFSLIRGFIGLIGIIMDCLASIGWIFLGEGIIINPFTFILQLFTLGVTPSISGALQVIITLLGGRFAPIAPLAEAVETGLYSYGIVEVADSIFKLGDKFKKWLEELK